MYVEEVLALLMFLALALLLFSGYPVAFVLPGVALGFGGLGMMLGHFSAIEFYNIVLRAWGGAASNLLLVAVPMFIYMGIMLERSGVAEDLLSTMQILLGRIRGGLAMAVTVMGTILAASTGIIGASVVMMGILIPPSIMLVIMGDLLSISVGDLFLGAVFPGLVLSGLYILYIGILSYMRPNLAPLMPREELQIPLAALAGRVLRTLLPPLFLIVIVLGSIFVGWATPTEAAGVGALGSVLLAWFNRRLNRETVVDVTQRTAKITAMVFMIVVGATAFSYVFRSLGGEDVIEAALLGLPFGSWGILFVLMSTVFLLGFFFDWIEITLIVLPVFGPIVGKLDFGPMFATVGDQTLWFAMLVAINLQTSFLTPPFGFALFYLKGVAPANVQLDHLYRGIIPFVILQLIGLVIVILFPELVTWFPKMALGRG